MTTNQNDNRNHNNDGMSKAKTNQDFNKQTPDPRDPNQENIHQIGEDDENEHQERKLSTGEEMHPYDVDFEVDAEDNEDSHISDQKSPRTSSENKNQRMHEDDKRMETHGWRDNSIYNQSLKHGKSESMQANNFQRLHDTN